MHHTPIPRQFDTTQWSLVSAAGNEDPDNSRTQEALEKLCQRYWFPLYAFLRSRGHPAHDAQDLTQAFLSQFIQSRGFASANPNRGRFRTYLLGCLKHFVTNAWNRSKALKRGGQTPIIEWDALEPEARYALEPHTPTNPDTRFDREWALTLVQQGLEQLQDQYAKEGKTSLFQQLKGCLTGSEPPRSITAAQLQISENQLKVIIHRLRRNYRDVIRELIADTVQTHSEIDDEMRHLLQVLKNENQPPA
jgi:RNA polymerase sigma-70 factor (ECF subfamily)